MILQDSKLYKLFLQNREERKTDQNKESACGLSACERCLKGKLLFRELRILPEGFALQEELSHVNVTRSFLQSKKDRCTSTV